VSSRLSICIHKARCIDLDLPQLPSLHALPPRFSSLGWPIAEVLSMDALAGNRRFLSLEDTRSMHVLAALDEYEEWLLVGSHYYLAILKNT